MLDVQRPVSRAPAPARSSAACSTSAAASAATSGTSTGRASASIRTRCRRRPAGLRGLTAFTHRRSRGQRIRLAGRVRRAADARTCSSTSRRSRRIALITTYLPYVRSGGRAVFITPQEAGYRSDPTHVGSSSIAELDSLARKAGLEPVRPLTRSRSRAPSGKRVQVQRVRARRAQAVRTRRGRRRGSRKQPGWLRR